MGRHRRQYTDKELLYIEEYCAKYLRNMSEFAEALNIGGYSRVIYETPELMAAIARGEARFHENIENQLSELFDVAMEEAKGHVASVSYQGYYCEDCEITQRKKGPCRICNGETTEQWVEGVMVDKTKRIGKSEPHFWNAMFYNIVNRKPNSKIVWSPPDKIEPSASDDDKQMGEWLEKAKSVNQYPETQADYDETLKKAKEDADKPIEEISVPKRDTTKICKNCDWYDCYCSQEYNENDLSKPCEYWTQDDPRHLHHKLCYHCSYAQACYPRLKGIEHGKVCKSWTSNVCYCGNNTIIGRDVCNNRCVPFRPGWKK